MPREARNIRASERARLLARSPAEKTDYQIVPTQCALERLLYRLSVFAYRNRFILESALRFVTRLTETEHKALEGTREALQKLIGQVSLTDVLYQ